MVIFLYGRDDYRREEKKRSIQAEFLKKYSGLAIGNFDIAEKEGLDDLRSFLKSQSIFEVKKIAFVENALQIETPDAFVKELAQFLKSKDTTIVLSENGKPTKSFSVLLEKPSLAQEFRPLEGKDWEKFVSDTAKKCGVALDGSAFAFLARTYAGNSWGLATEMQKLSLLGKKSITQKDLEKTMLEVMPDFWSVMNGLKSHEIGRRLFMLEKLFAVHEPAAKIFNMLASLRKERAREFAGYDLKIKSGKLEYEEALVDAVLTG